MGSLFLSLSLFNEKEMTKLSSGAMENEKVLYIVICEEKVIKRRGEDGRIKRNRLWEESEGIR